MKSIVFCDIDGTLVKRNTSVVNAEVLNTITDFVKQENFFVLCTGRWIYRIQPVTKVLNKNFNNVQYAISLAGSYVYNVQTEECVFKVTIEPNIAKKLLEFIEQYKLTSLVYCDYAFKIRSPIGFNIRHERFYSYLSEKLKIIRYQKGFDCDNVYKLIFPFALKRTGQKILKILESLKPFLKIIQTRFYLEVLPANINKGEAAKMLVKYLKLDKTEYKTISIGDSENDLDMLYATNQHFVVSSNPAKSKLKRYNFPIIDNHHYDAVECVLKSLMIQERNE